MDSNASHRVRPANTGSVLRDRFADTVLQLVRLERRIDPWLRPAFDRVLRDPIERIAAAAIDVRRHDEGLQLAEERPLPGEDGCVDSIVDSLWQQLNLASMHGGIVPDGGGKTHGAVRGEFVVHDRLPAGLRRGIFAVPRRFAAWVRFSGSAPDGTPDIDDIGPLAIGIKLMGVPGRKLIDEERATQDLLGVSTPTLPARDVRAAAQLQKAGLRQATMFYFLNLREPHLAELVMQALWVRTQSSPFESPYFSGLPYLLGEGQVMQYSVWPASSRHTPVPNLPRRPPDDYLRAAMVAALAAGDVVLDFRVQLQVDPYRMPIEHAGVPWPTRLSPRVSVATLRLPRQMFDSPAQLAFARRLSYDPWHCIAEHRPLGNQGRARRRIHLKLAQLRHRMADEALREPDGSEAFDAAPR